MSSRREAPLRYCLSYSVRDIEGKIFVYQKYYQKYSSAQKNKKKYYFDKSLASSTNCCCDDKLSSGPSFYDFVCFVCLVPETLCTA